LGDDEGTTERRNDGTRYPAATPPPRDRTHRQRAVGEVVEVAGREVEVRLGEARPPPDDAVVGAPSAAAPPSEDVAEDEHRGGGGGGGGRTTMPAQQEEEGQLLQHRRRSVIRPPPTHFGFGSHLLPSYFSKDLKCVVVVVVRHPSSSSSSSVPIEFPRK
jgi:hypothetical protein